MTVNTKYITVLLSLFALSCGSSSQTAQSTQPPLDVECGIERWHVKTLLDPDTAKIVWTPVASSIAEQSAFSRVSVNLTAPRLDFEEQVTAIQCTIVSYKREDDNDIHLILQDSAGNQMIAEIPSVSCAEVMRTSHGMDYGAATDWVTANLGKPTTSFKDANKAATVTGVLFQDFSHGQKGAAPSQREIHPVLSIK